jgi:hypothetical protein
VFFSIHRKIRGCRLTPGTINDRGPQVSEIVWDHTHSSAKIVLGGGSAKQPQASVSSNVHYGTRLIISRWSPHVVVSRGRGGGA